MRSVVRTLGLFLLTLSSINASTDEFISLQFRWSSIQVNCTAVPSAPVDSVSVQQVTAILNGDATESQWLHDIGEWHLLHGGNMAQAEQFLRASADLGHAGAQFLVGALVATDSSRVHEPDAALFYHFAAMQGSPLAAMALGYRHFHGYGSVRSCDIALRHYKTAADYVVRHKHALPNPSLPIQYYAPPPPSKLSDDQSKLPERESEERERVDYLRLRSASSTNTELLVRTASLVLFSDIYQHHLDDHIAHTEAVQVLQRAAELGSDLASALLGHVYTYGLVNGQNNVYEAIALYESVVATNKTHAIGYAEAANGLGRVYFYGVGGVAIDYERAMGHFKMAQRAGHADAVFNAAVLMTNSHPDRALQYLQGAAEVGHIGAIFQLARRNEKLLFRGDRNNNCDAVVKLYKRVAEHNQYGMKLMRAATDAYLDSRFDHALRLYQIAAELGYDVAEHNAAWLMERYTISTLQAAASDHRFKQLVAKGMAQDSADAFVVSGDLAFAVGDYRLAMQRYLTAIQLAPRHARALYSAGYMCEYGLGTISRGRNLGRARGYYVRAQQAEPILVYLMTLLTWRVDAKLGLQAVWQWLQSKTEEADDTTASQADTSTVNLPSNSRSEIVFASAMVFDGDSSRVIVDGERSAAIGSATVDLWLWIESPSTTGGESQAIIEWQDGIAVILQPHYDGSSWQLSVRSSLVASVLLFTEASFAAKRWYHVAITVDDLGGRYAVSLAVNGQRVDAGSLARVYTYSNRLMLSVGQPLGASVGCFNGQLMNVRVWDTALATDAAQRLGSTDGCPQDTQLMLVCSLISARITLQSRGLALGYWIDLVDAIARWCSSEMCNCAWFASHHPMQLNR